MNLVNLSDSFFQLCCLFEIIHVLVQIPQDVKKDIDHVTAQRKYDWAMCSRENLTMIVRYPEKFTIIQALNKEV